MAPKSEKSPKKAGKWKVANVIKSYCSKTITFAKLEEGSVIKNYCAKNYLLCAI